MAGLDVLTGTDGYEQCPILHFLVERRDAMREAFDTSRAVAEELLNVSVSDVAPDTILCMAVGEIDFSPGLLSGRS